jgi:hypothetical protein
MAIDHTLHGYAKVSRTAFNLYLHWNNSYLNLPCSSCLRTVWIRCLPAVGLNIYPSPEPEKPHGFRYRLTPYQSIWILPSGSRGNVWNMAINNFHWNKTIVQISSANKPIWHRLSLKSELNGPWDIVKNIIIRIHEGSQNGVIFEIYLIRQSL